MAGAREGRRGGAWTAKDRGEAWNIGMLGQRQVMPRWADDPVQIHDRRWWRGCQGRRGLPPRKDTRLREERAGRDKYIYVTMSDIAYVTEGSLSEVGTPKPHDLDTIHGMVAGKKTHTHTLTIISVSCSRSFENQPFLA